MKPIEKIKIYNLEDIIDDSQNYYYTTYDSTYSVYTLNDHIKIADLEVRPEAIIRSNGEYLYLNAEYSNFKIRNSEGKVLKEFEDNYIARTDSTLILFEHTQNEDYLKFMDSNIPTTEEYNAMRSTTSYRIFTYPEKYEMKKVTSMEYKYINNEHRIFCVDSLNNKINFNISFQDTRMDGVYYTTTGWGQSVKLSYSVVGNDTIDGIKLDFL